MILSRDNEDIRHSLDESCYNIWIARQNDRDILHQSEDVAFRASKSTDYESTASKP